MRQHGPIRIQKHWSLASLQFYSALARNKTFTVTMEFVTQNPGQMVLDHTVKLTGAGSTSFASYSELGQLPVTDTIELVSQKIEMVDLKGGAVVRDGVTP